MVGAISHPGKPGCEVPWETPPLVRASPAPNAGLDNLGRIRLNAGPRSLSGRVRQVFDLIVQAAAGPVSSV